MKSFGKSYEVRPIPFLRLILGMRNLYCLEVMDFVGNITSSAIATVRTTTIKTIKKAVTEKIKVSEIKSLEIKTF